jgi:hypothetical protein
VRSSEGRRQLPVAFDIAIPVESTAKAGALECTGVAIDIAPGQLVWNRMD